MSKKTTTVRSSSVVRANKRGGSGLPGAAQRARSRQRGATLRTAIALLNSAEIWLGIGHIDTALNRIVCARTWVRKALGPQPRRRPFGANVLMSDGQSERESK